MSTHANYESVIVSDADAAPGQDVFLDLRRNTILIPNDVKAAFAELRQALSKATAAFFPDLLDDTTTITPPRPQAAWALARTLFQTSGLTLFALLRELLYNLPLILQVCGLLAIDASVLAVVFLDIEDQPPVGILMYALFLYISIGLSWPLLKYTARDITLSPRNNVFKLGRCGLFAEESKTPLHIVRKFSERDHALVAHTTAGTMECAVAGEGTAHRAATVLNCWLANWRNSGLVREVPDEIWKRRAETYDITKAITCEWGVRTLYHIKGQRLRSRSLPCGGFVTRLPARRPKRAILLTMASCALYSSAVIVPRLVRGGLATPVLNPSVLAAWLVHSVVIGVMMVCLGRHTDLVFKRPADWSTPASPPTWLHWFHTQSFHIPTRDLARVEISSTFVTGRSWGGPREWRCVLGGGAFDLVLWDAASEKSFRLAYLSEADVLQIVSWLVKCEVQLFAG